MEHAQGGGRQERLLVRRRQQTVFTREHGSHRPRRRSLRHRDAAQPAGGRAVSPMAANPHTRVVPGVGSAQSALQRRAARLLVRPPGAATLHGSLVHRVGLEHAADPAPAGPAATQHRRCHRRVRTATPAPGLLQDPAARRPRDRHSDQAHLGQAPRGPLPQGPPRRCRGARVQANAPWPPRPRHGLPQDHQATACTR